MHFPSCSRLLLLLPVLLAAACSSDWRRVASQPDVPSAGTGADWYGDAVVRARTLPQGWSPEDRRWFATTTQGSQLLPLVFYQNLEQAEGTELLNSERNVRRYRFLTNGDRHELPVGFVPDGSGSLPASLEVDTRWVGLTCAACHNTQINYQSTALRIDGAAGLGDFQGFLAALAASLEATAADEAKFARFAVRVRPGASPEQLTTLRAALRETAGQRTAYEKLNATSVADGFGRLDAFTRIFNRVLSMHDPRNRLTPVAPVSIPFLWDAAWADRVQWTGNAPNGTLGSLGRNVGEVVGVFAQVNPRQGGLLTAYGSSANVRNLLEFERRLLRLKSPRWPEAVLGRIDPGQRAHGAKIYDSYCVDCHPHRNPDDRARKWTSKMDPLTLLKTDRKAAEIIATSKGYTGIAEGRLSIIKRGGRMERVEAASLLTGETVARVILGGGRARLNREQAAQELRLSNRAEDKPVTLAERLTGGPGDAELEYRGRTLNGIWATAPYLHNGSVPNLEEILKPARERSVKFAVGRREFDPVRVGFRTEEVPGVFMFDTGKPGNSNAGHEGALYGTKLSPEDRAALLEYLKSI